MIGFCIGCIVGILMADRHIHYLLLLSLDLSDALDRSWRAIYFRIYTLMKIYDQNRKL